MELNDKSEKGVETPLSPSLSMDDLTREEIFPDVKQNAIDAVTASKEASKNEALQNAQPVKLKKDGTPAKPRGRKPGQQNASTSQIGISQNKIDPNAPQKVSSRGTAVVASGVLERMQVMLISDEFIYSEIERLANVDAWEKTFDYYGGVAVSPPVELMISHMQIILTRANKPKTKTRIQLLAAYMADKIARLKRTKKNAHSDSGTDVERKDNLGEEKSPIA